MSDSVNQDGAQAERIRQLYSEPHFPGAGAGLSGFYRALKDQGKSEGLSLDQVREILSEIPSFLQQTSHTYRNFPRRKTVAYGQGITFHADLGEMPERSTFSYIFVLYDIFSHYGYASPLANKEAATCRSALIKLRADNPEQLSRMNEICVDQGSEFKSVFKKYCTEQGIYITLMRSRNHAYFAEWYLRHLKGRIMTLCRANLSDNWPAVLPDAVAAINNSYCSSIDNIPSKVNAPQYDPAVRAALARNSARREKERTVNVNRKYREIDDLEVGSFCYADVPRSSLEKGYDIKRTRVYVIAAINKLQRPWIYSLKDASTGKPAVGGYYRAELVRAPDPSRNNRSQLFPVEKILAERTRKGKRELLVKFLHYPNRYLLATNYLLLYCINE